MLSNYLANLKTKHHKIAANISSLAISITTHFSYNFVFIYHSSYSFISYRFSFTFRKINTQPTVLFQNSLSYRFSFTFIKINTQPTMLLHNSPISMFKLIYVLMCLARFYLFGVPARKYRHHVKICRNMMIDSIEI